MAQRICTQPDCSRPVLARDLCRLHYDRRRAGRPLDAPPPDRAPRGSRPCAAEGCDGSARSRGLCASHYMKQYVRPTVCAIDGCDGREHARRYCLMHYGILQRFSLAPEVWEQMYAMQGGACMICHRAITRSQANTDHDHACCPSTARSCGRCVRGLLCVDCNHALGRVRDDPSVLASAIRYLLAFPH